MQQWTLPNPQTINPNCAAQAILARGQLSHILAKIAAAGITLGTKY